MDAPTRALRPRLPVLLPLGLGLAGLAAAACSDSPTHGEEVAADAYPAFVDEAGCLECHVDQAEAWRGSHHDLAMQEATEETVLGDFDDALFEHEGATTRFHRRDGRFLVTTEGPDGAPAEFEVAYVFGYYPLQQVLIELPRGRLQCLTVAWDVEGQRWYTLYPDEEIPADDAFHWTGLYQRWNMMCADCHSTGLARGYDGASDGYDTTWEKLDVGCQACHGPGAVHVDWARRVDAGELPAETADEGDHGLVVDYGRVPDDDLVAEADVGDAHYEVDRCARCHSRRTAITTEFRHGRPFLDDYVPQLLRQGLYHPDGQVLDEVYVYGSFLQSKMYEKGVRCSDCHDAHSAGLRAEGDALCAQCHSEFPPIERFPTLQAKAYDAREHHHHDPEQEGARCVACHMPAKNYMGVDPRHDHSIRVPRPDLAAVLGTPDACSGCHVEHDARWAAEEAEAWWGPPEQTPPSFAPVLAAARVGLPDAAGALAAVAADISRPAIVRASALDALRAYGQAGMGALAGALEDPEPLVRATAARSLDVLPEQVRPVLLGPLLDDPVRAVRIQAARSLAGVPAETMDEATRVRLAEVLPEWEEAQAANADMPAAQLNLGSYEADLGHPDRAELAYRRALELDPGFLPACFNLSGLLNSTGRNHAAERVLIDALRRSPDEGELHYSLGLLLGEMERYDRSAEQLSIAADLMPERPRVRYNQGLALQRNGRVEEAEAALARALEVAPEEPDFLNALAVLHVQQERWETALPYAERLVAAVPGAPGPRQMLERIRSELSASR